MLDPPAQSQTSPTRRPCAVRVDVPATARSAPTEFAASGASTAIQRPSGPAVAPTFWPAKDTVRCSPGAARPQTGTGLSLCRTLLPMKSGASSGAAPAGAAHPAAISARSRKGNMETP